jgi:hypothetical protein
MLNTNDYEQYLGNHAVTAGSLALSTFGVVGSLYLPSSPLQVPLGGFIAGSAAIGLASAHRREREDELNRASQQVRHSTEAMLSGAKGWKTSNVGEGGDYLALPSSAHALKALLAKRDRYSFVILLASQGSGKTFTASAMQALTSSQGVVNLTISSHVKPGDFPATDYKLVPDFGDAIGEDGAIDLDKMQNYLSKEEFFLSETEDLKQPLSSVVAGADSQGNLKGSIWGLILAIYAEFSQRVGYLQTGGDPDKLQPIDVYFDESSAAYARMSTRKIEWEGEQIKLSDLWQTMLIRPAMMEFRKYKIRLFMITQSKTAKSLGMENLAELRDEYAYIRVGQSAIDYAKDSKMPSSKVKAAERARFPIMIDEDLYGVLDYELVQTLLSAVAARGTKNLLHPIPWERPVKGADKPTWGMSDDEFLKLKDKFESFDSSGLSRSQILKKLGLYDRYSADKAKLIYQELLDRIG